MSNKPFKPHTNDNEMKIALLEKDINFQSSQLNRIELRVDKIEARIESLEQSMKEGFNRIENKIDTIVNRLESKIDRLDNRLWITLFAVVASFATYFANKFYHWV